MEMIRHGDTVYELDSDGFLADPGQWDEEFPRVMAPAIGIKGDLTRDHWNVINLIRDVFRKTGKCPLIYEACRMVGMRLKDLELLFPTGYLRGACRLAGVTYREGSMDLTHWPEAGFDADSASVNKVYTVDVRGFLIDYRQWDEYFAVHRAYEMKLPGGSLTNKHWGVIRFLRESFAEDNEVPTIYEVCERCGLIIDEMERLFPDGYHRGAVKIAGLRVR